MRYATVNLGGGVQIECIKTTLEDGRVEFKTRWDIQLSDRKILAGMTFSGPSEEQARVCGRGLLQAARDEVTKSGTLLRRQMGGLVGNAEIEIQTPIPEFAQGDI